LGERWIGFWTDGQDTIGFHGTPNVKSIGTAASHGCVRMYNQDVRVLFDLVKVGTPVQVIK
jgi:lipoprotein-anchoring transpeptidase ErfK/SrfK